MGDGQEKLNESTPCLKEIIEDLRKLAFEKETRGDADTSKFLYATARAIESAVLSDTLVIHRAVQDAIAMYQELYALAMDERQENELKIRAAIANKWLEANCWPKEPLTWRKKKESII